MFQKTHLYVVVGFMKDELDKITLQNGLFYTNHY